MLVYVKMIALKLEDTWKIRKNRIEKENGLVSALTEL